LATETEVQARDRGAGTLQRAHWLATVFRDRIAADTAVLEVGSGTELLAQALARAGLRMYTARPSAALAQPPAGRPRAHAVIASARQLPFRSGHFGAVVATTLHEYRPPGPVLREVARVLRHGREHLIAVPDPGGLTDDPIARILRPMRRRLGRGTDRNAETLASIAACCDDLGLTCYSERLPPYSYLRSPAREAQDIMDRASSVLWGIDDTTWDKVVQPAVRELLALPEPGRPLTRQATYLLMVITADGQKAGAVARGRADGLKARAAATG
jgi:SAM-dependent methyltransferase